MNIKDPYLKHNQAFMNNNHEYEHVSSEIAKTAGFRNANEMIGTTVFDFKSSVAEISGSIHESHINILKYEKTVLTLDICAYDEGVKWYIWQKTPQYNNGKIAGIYSCSSPPNEITSATPFIRELYQQAIYLNRSSRFSGVVYKIINAYTPHELNEQESKILFLLAHGKSMKKIAALIYLSPRTVEFYVDRIKQKLKLKNKEQLIEYAIYNRLIDSIPKSLVFNT